MQLSHCRITAFILIVALIMTMQPSPVHAQSDKEAIKKIYTFGVIAGAFVVAAIGYAIVHGFKKALKTITKKGDATTKQIDFGSKPIGANGEQTVVLINKDKARLVIEDISVSGDCFSILRRPDADPLILSSMEEMQVVVGFTAKFGMCKGILQVSTKVNRKRNRVKFHMKVQGF